MPKYLCAALGCNRARKRTQIMCSDCWDQVPGEIQQRVLKAAGDNTTGKMRYSPEHCNATMEAVRSLPRRSQTITRTVNLD